MDKPRLYADFHNADVRGRVRLNCVGTEEDLAQYKIELRKGLAITLYADELDARGNSDELVVDAVVEYSEDERCWVAVIDWNAIRHVSDGKRPSSNGSLGSAASSIPPHIHS